MAESNTNDVQAFFEQELGLPDGFFDKLLHEDDWSFVIKLHALFEGVVTQLLVKALGHERLSDVLSQLPISDETIGKMVFVRDLGLLEARLRKFINDLSSLRNSLVHNVRNVQFDFKEYIKGLDKNQRRKFRDNFGFVFETLDGGVVQREALMAENPKMIVLASAYECLIFVYLKRLDARIKLLDAAIARAVYEKSQMQKGENS